MNAQQLKNSILQEAIEGRLVPQDPNDEPASVLLERIRKEKKRLVKEGKLKKKDIEEIPISKDEIPFEIPTGWEWTKMFSLTTIITKGTTPRGGNVAYFDKGIGFLRAENVDGIDRLNLKNLKYIDKETNDGYLKRSILQENDVLITIAGTLGRTALVRKKDLPLNANQAISLCRFVDFSSIDLKYVLFALNAPAIQEQFHLSRKVTAIPNLTLEIISDTLIPLPPLDEQHRIVAKIEELLPEVEGYGEGQETLDKLNAELPEQLKKSILQEAIEGRLVPQDPNEEPASVLLEKIRKEKKRLVKEGKLKKKDLEEIPISKEEIPFEIPEGWEWVRINYIANSQLGKTLDKGKQVGDEYPYLCSINVYWDGIDLSKVKTFLLKPDELTRYRLNKGDLLVCEGGDYGRCCVWDRNEEMYYQNALHRVRFYGGISSCFYKYVFELYRYTDYIVGQGQTIKHFTYENMKSILFPLPPLQEQHRIVLKIEQLLNKINQLKEEK